MLTNFFKNALKSVSLIYILTGIIFAQEMDIDVNDLDDLINSTEFSNLPISIQESILARQAEVEEAELSPDNEIIDSLEKGDEEKDYSDLPYGFQFFEYEPLESMPTLDVPLQSDYQIAFNDELELLFSGNVNRLIKLRVDLAGNILIPEIGKTNVLGLSIFAATKKIQNLVEGRYVGTQANLNVLEAGLKKISVIGAVKNPGTYIVNPFISLTEAIKYAGGMLENSSLRNIKVTRLGGEVVSLDLYDFLIFGDRNSDINLQNGDTVMVDATSNFYSIEGEVNRVGIYEYKYDDKYIDLFKFALGFKKEAKIDSVQATVIRDGRIENIPINANSSLNEEVSLTNLYVPSEIKTDNLDVLVVGSEVTNGFITIEGTENLESFLNRIEFSNQVYPFYAILVNEDINEINYSSFSLFDKETLKEKSVSKNSRLYFYSRDQINELSINIEEYFSDIDIEYDINNYFLDSDQEILDLTIMAANDFKQFQFGDFNLFLPLSGKLTIKDIYSWADINLNKVSTRFFVVANESSYESDANQVINSRDLVSASVSFEKKDRFFVEILGQVNSPGRYLVNNNTSLNDLYKIAGGLTSSADASSIYVSRESIKEREKAAFEDSKNIITDAVINNLANPTGTGNLSIADFSAILDLSKEIEFYGRISGDFAPDSNNSNNLYLEEGDIIQIFGKRDTVTVVGEVLNPSTIVFDSKLEASQYIKRAGGLTRYADRNSIYIIRSNGESVPINGIGNLGKTVYLNPGDTVVIPRNLDKVNLIPLISTATGILSNLAFAAASLNAIR